MYCTCSPFVTGEGGGGRGGGKLLGVLGLRGYDGDIWIWDVEAIYDYSSSMPVRTETVAFSV